MDKQKVYNSIQIKNLNDSEQYFIRNVKWAKCNKNNTLDEYVNEVNKGMYDLMDIKITKELYFLSSEALIIFSNMFLDDFNFLKNTGGTATDDKRINNIEDYWRMSAEERETVTWYRLGIAVYYKDKLQYVIDPQGYSYARYIGLTDTAINEKNNNVIDITAKIKQRQENESLQEDIEKFKNEYLPYFTEDDLRALLNTNKKNWGEELIKICMRIDLERMMQEQI